jgi:MFS family permease
MLCSSALLFFASFNMIIPKLPVFLSSLGGAEYKGLIISAFTVTALLSRPFSGKLADTIGRVPVILVGSSVCLICSLIYPLLTTVYGFVLLRLIHGFSTGFTPTGQTAYLSDVIPANRRGEAMGVLGTAGTLGMASGPALGGLVANAYGLRVMFYCSSVLALLSIMIIAGTLHETLPKKRPFSRSLLAVQKHEWFEPLVLVPCIVMILCAYAYGTVYTLLPDFGYHVGIKNEGILFSYFTIASLVVRLIGGKASDRFGRRAVLFVSTTCIVVSMLIIAFADTKSQLIAGVVLYGFAQGATSPTLLAWATDLSHPLFRGRGVASLYMSMEAGIGIGAFASGLIFANRPENFFTSFLICSALAGVAFVYLIIQRSFQK